MTFDDLRPSNKRTFAGAEESGVHDMSVLIRKMSLKKTGEECFMVIERVFNYSVIVFEHLSIQV